jgi:hypothetical protein
MKIAIYRHPEVRVAALTHGRGFFDRVIHEDHLGKLKGLRSVPEENCEIYCFDGTSVEAVLPNLSSGFSMVAVFRVFSAEFLSLH